MTVSHRCRAQGVVEFGIVAVLLVFLIAGGIDLGLMVTARQRVSVADGQAGQQAAYGASLMQIESAAQHSIRGAFFDPNGLAIIVSDCDATGSNCTQYCDGFLTTLQGAPYLDPVRPAGCQDLKAANYTPASRHWVTVTLWLESYEVLTPPIRLIVQNSNDLCSRGDAPCYLRLTSSETVLSP